MRLEDLNAPGDGRLASPSAERNRELIAKVLSQVLPQSGLVLEVGSGTGEHVIHFARVMPYLAWQPSEIPLRGAPGSPKGMLKPAPRFVEACFD